MGLTGWQDEGPDSHAVGGREPAQVAIVVDVEKLAENQDRRYRLVHCRQGQKLGETKNKHKDDFVKSFVD